MVMIAYQPSPDGLVGHVYVYGCGRYAAARTKVVLENLPSPEAISLSITRDHAAELSSALRKLSRAAGTVVGVGMYAEAIEGHNPETGASSWGNLAVIWQEKYLTHLHDADVHGKYDNVWGRVDELASANGNELAAVALQVSVLSRVSKMKGAFEVADIRATPLPGVVAVKLGTNIVALLGEVNKAGFAAGGKWGNGPGGAEQLWPSAA